MNNPFDIAIVGMSCRLPGARNVDEFWQNLANGVESITRFSDRQILESGVPASHLSKPNYVKAAPVLDDPGYFDARFFGFSPMEAQAMDPQHRILLELAYEALENAGYDVEHCEQRIGVFTGAALNTYFMYAGLGGRLPEEYIPTLIGNDKDFLSTRISYKLNLKGPSITVQTACSTSLVAVHLARQSLLSQETDMAIAGAISLRVPHCAGYFADAGGVTSPDGHVRAFDSRANGTVFGSGGGIIVLKRLTDALSDGDTIHAVIKGSAVNNDGSEKAGYTAPSVNSQADAVVEALANAGVEADTVSYVEAHGSGTPVGDPIEIRALTKAFRTFTQRSQYCAIGSVKTNVGHLDVAAGIASIIKTVLALQHRQLPASLNFTEPNPEIDFPSTPFYVNTRLREWNCEGPKRAGVMSTGMGGTNAHIVLEESPRERVVAHNSPPYLLVLSAKTETALNQAAHRLRNVLNDGPSVNMADVAYTLQIGRKSFSSRRYLVCNNREEAISALNHEDSKAILSNCTDGSRRRVIFLLPGIGDHYVGMAHDLYETFPVFKQEVDRCSGILEPHLKIDLKTVIYPSSESWKKGGQSQRMDLKKMVARKPDAPEDQAARNLNRTLLAQPALFAVEYAMSRLWQSFGIDPDAIVGHSMGEYVAACLAGVLSLEDALQLIAARAKLVEQLPEGAMLAVMLSENELRLLLTEELSISLINGPNLCVVAGPIAAVSEFEKILTARGVICRHVQNAHAFHSRMLDPILPPFQARVDGVQLNAPRIPYISNVTGTWITAHEATSSAYWAMHANQTARFSDALHQLWQVENPILIEAGPGRTLGVLAMQHPDRRNVGEPLILSSIRHHYENRSNVESLWDGIGRLWLSGSEIKWAKVHTGESLHRVPLPTYPFERQNYWLEAGGAKSAEHTPAPASSGVDDWFYVPVWQRTRPSRRITQQSTLEEPLWLIFADRDGGGGCIKTKLEALGRPARLIRFGETLVGGREGFEVNPVRMADYTHLFRQLEGQSKNGINIIHLGALKLNEKGKISPGAWTQDFGFYSLLHIAQAIGDLNLSVPIKIGILTHGIHAVTGEDCSNPLMATVLGPCGVIPKEFPNVKCFNIDLDMQALDNLSDELFAAIVSEFAEPSRHRVLAYRGRYRWQRAFKRVELSDAPAAEAVTTARLRPGGVYLITGGTGGLGLVIARYLAMACRPKIVLTKKNAFPDKSMWSALATRDDSPAPVRRIAKALLELEELGAEVEVLVGDSADKRQMQNIFNEIRSRFKTIHGVIHAAGIVRAGLIQAKTKEVADSVLAPKVSGTIILFDLLKDVRPDFLVLFSSITSIITPYAESDYSAANSFLDSFAQFANADGSFRTLSINWPGWKEVGQLAELVTLPGVEGWKEAALKKAISTKDGLEAFKRALHSDFTQVIVSPENLDDLLKESGAPFDPAIYLSQLQSGANTVARDDDGRGNGESRPGNEVERSLTRIWSGVLGFGRIEPHDNFSQLGGHSLLAMQIVAKIRSVFGIDFGLREFFEAPTISALAGVIQARIAGASESPTNNQAAQVLSPMGQRFFCASRIPKAFFFGPSDQRLFAMYHPPLTAPGEILTILCPPLFNEYMRTQLALRELAISLAEKGQHVLRFDYRGTGDSFGDLDDVTITEWLEDIALTVREGRRLSGSGVVQLLGIRGGALLACRAAGDSEEIQRLVLWDPVPDGARYLQALRRIQAGVINANIFLNRADRRESLLCEYGGHRLSERMLEQLRLLDASAYSSISKDKITVVSTSPKLNWPVPGVLQEVSPFSCNWETDLESLMMPKPVLECLTTCLTMS